MKVAIVAGLFAERYMDVDASHQGKGMLGLQNAMYKGNLFIASITTTTPLIAFQYWPACFQICFHVLRLPLSGYLIELKWITHLLSLLTQ